MLLLLACRAKTNANLFLELEGLVVGVSESTQEFGPLKLLQLLPLLIVLHVAIHRVEDVVAAVLVHLQNARVHYLVDRLLWQVFKEVPVAQVVHTLVLHAALMVLLGSAPSAFQQDFVDSTRL